MRGPLGSHLAAGDAAGAFERVYLRLVGAPEPALRARTRHVLRAVRALRPRNILDVGCGAGFGAISLALALPDATVVGVDRNEAQLARAAQLAAASGAANASFESTPLQALGSASFDVVVVSDALEYFDDDADALRVLRDVLRPSGRLVVHCRAVPTPRYLRSFRSADPLRDGRLREGYTPDRLRSLLVDAGFTPLTITHTLGPAAELAHELVDPELGRFRGRVSRALAAPVLVAGTVRDRPRTRGAGLLAVAAR